MPFDDLKSEEAQAKLSACRPASAFENPTVREGVPRYSPLGLQIQSRGRVVARQVVAPRSYIMHALGGAGGSQNPRSHYGGRILQTEDYADSCLNDGLHS